MSTCKDCLHCEACKGTYYTAKGDEDILYEFESEMYAHSGCEHFKPKADYAPVVRCKDCKDCELCYPVKVIGEEAVEGYYCHTNRIYVKPTDFCSYGERKEK